jgi:hypothetical protein
VPAEQSLGDPSPSLVTSPRLDSMGGLSPTEGKVIAMPARRSKAAARTKSATRKKTTTRRKPAAKKTATRKKTTTRRKPAAKKTATRKKTTTRRKPAAKTPEQLGAPLPPPEPVRPVMPVSEPSLIREEPATQPASPLPEMEEAEERGFSTDFSEREDEPEKDS